PGARRNGSSAVRSQRPATTSSASSRTSWSTGPGSATAPSLPSRPTSAAAPAPLMTASGVSRFVTASDRLRLHVREYGERGSRHLLVACLCDAVHAAVAGGGASNPAVGAPIDGSSHR